jgi:hypothetical protein
MIFGFIFRQTIENLPQSANLKSLFLGKNKITKIEGLDGLTGLTTLSIQSGFHRRSVFILYHTESNATMIR